VFILDIAILLPFFSGLILGAHAILRPAAPPNFDSYFKRRYKRSEWNDRNPEDFTRKIGIIILIVAIIYGALVVTPWVLH